MVRAVEQSYQATGRMIKSYNDRISALAKQMQQEPAQ